MTTRIEIYRDGVWAGTGTIDSDGDIQCPAVLGPDQDASDETYEAIQDAIDSELQDDERYSGAGEVERPDGIYSWSITESREYDYATDGEMGVIVATDFADACRQLDAMFTPAILAAGGQGWVEDRDGERYRIGYDAE